MRINRYSKDGETGSSNEERKKLDNFLSSPANALRVQQSLFPDHSKNINSLRLSSFMAFCFGLRLDWVRGHLLRDGSGRLWNNTRWKNYNQEKALIESENPRIEASLGSYIFHYRGSTLEPGPCKNGWLDCAMWQNGHRPDMASPWFKPDRDLRNPNVPWRDPRHDPEYTGK